MNIRKFKMRNGYGYAIVYCEATSLNDDKKWFGVHVFPNKKMMTMEWFAPHGNFFGDLRESELDLVEEIFE